MKKILIPICIIFIFLIYFELGNSLEETGALITITQTWVTDEIIEMTGTRIKPLKKYTLSPIHKRLDSLPFFEDSSIFRFVSRDTPLTLLNYEPNDLVSISGSHIDTAGRTGLRLRREAAESLSIMALDFEKRFGIPLTVISTYRSAAYQQRMWDLGKCSDTLCAPPGYSEHQLGLAMDIFDATTEDTYLKNKNYRKYIEWFKVGAQRYGWNQSYQKWETIDNYQIEPWHWRYLGVDMATKLSNLGWTYTEYVRFQEVLARNY